VNWASKRHQDAMTTVADVHEDVLRCANGVGDVHGRLAQPMVAGGHRDSGGEPDAGGLEPTEWAPVRWRRPVAYPDVLRSLLNLPESKRMVLGIALGYPDTSKPAATFRSSREPMETLVTWHGFE